VRILVTGGAGYVGSVTVDRLIDAGHDVIVLDDLSTGHRAAVAGDARLIVGSYGDADTIRGVLDELRIEAVLHCAARSLVGESIADPARYYRDNVAGGVVLLEAVRLAGIRRIVFSSTAAVYGLPGTTPIGEDTPERPINTYGETKRTFEAAMAAYGPAYGLRSVTLRYFNVAGATEARGEDHDPETHLIPTLLRAAAGEGPELTLFGDDYPTQDGTCVRDYIHVGDLADAHLRALEATAPGDNRTNVPLVCNLGSGGGFSVREVLGAAERVVGRPIPHTIGPRRPGDPPVLIAAVDRANAVLGWEPRQSSLDGMIRSAWDWQRRHPGAYPD
jgi:UDP-glucose-4-epimerase GalE